MSQLVATTKNEDLAVVTAKALGKRYPNVHFSAEENGAGAYNILVTPIHHTNQIPDRTMTMFFGDFLLIQETFIVMLKEGFKIF